MQVTKSDIAKAKKVSCYALMNEFGYQPEQERGNELVYKSPWIANQNTGSFWLNTVGNVFNDFANGYKGDSITLYMKLTGKNFPQAVWELALNQTVSDVDFKPVDLIKKERKRAEIVEIKEISASHLINYIESRGIDPELCKRYCKEIHYRQPNGKIYSSIGFQNDFGGWELRSAGFKSFVGKKKGVTLLNRSHRPLIVTEGFFSYIAGLQLNFYSQNCNALILNSLSFLDSFDFSKYNEIALFLDYDGVGKEATKKIIKKYPNNIFYDKAQEIGYKKDLNDHLIFTLQ